MHKLNEQKKCECGAILWEWIDDNTIKILGLNGQDYEVGFNFVTLKCKNCGEYYVEHSEIADQLTYISQSIDKHPKVTSFSYLPNPYDLGTFDRNALLGKLSEVQRKIYSLLRKQGRRIDIKKISEELGLPQERIARGIQTVERKIKEIKPDFGKLVKTTTTKQPVMSMDETKDLDRNL